MAKTHMRVTMTVGAETPVNSRPEAMKALIIREISQSKAINKSTIHLRVLNRDFSRTAVKNLLASIFELL